MWIDKRLWPLYLVAGILMIIFGVVMALLPTITFTVFLLFFGIIAIMLGIMAFIRMIFSIKSHNRWWFFLIEAILGIAIGILVLVFPRDSILAILYFIGGWAILIGLWEILYGIDFRREIKNESLLILSGIISLLVGILIFIRPGAGAFLLLALIVFYIIVRGVISIMLSIRLKRSTKGEV